MLKNKMLQHVALGALVTSGMSSTAFAQLQDEVIVTATKRAETASDVPIAVAALGEKTLDELNVNIFTDYLVQLPGVSAGGSGPGQSTIYIRGVASTTPTLSIAGVAGLAPNVAFYLDEQPLSQPGRNLDVYAADLERVEVLSGPQGTLFGASSQAGTVRLITNKPKLGVEEASFKMGTSFTKGGEMSYNAEAVYNAPVGENTALRAVIYFDDQGGYIDNKPGTINLRESARFRPAGTVRSNGVPVAPFRGGFTSTPADIAALDAGDVNFIDADNSNIAEDDFNDTQYFGFRLSARHEFNDDWSLDVGYGHQELDSEGVFFYDPNIDGEGELSINRFEDEYLEDDFDNVNWTLKGRLGELEALYTGAFTDRDTNQRIDYTDYLFVGQYLPYYICEGSVTYANYYSGTPAGTCYAPNSAVPSISETKVQTHEFRVNTPAENRWRATVGAFYSDLELKERNDFQYFGFLNPGVAFGANNVANFAQTNARPDFVTPGAFPAETVFRNDIRRTDEQFGVFGEGTFDISDQFALTVGARYYDIAVDLEGSANATFCNSGGTDENAFGTNISDLYDGDGSYTFIGSCNQALHQVFDLTDTIASIEAAGLSTGQATQVFNALRAPDKAETSGVIMKVTGTYTPNDDLLFYATYSQGFRPGLLNRPGGAFQPATNFTVPFELDTDDVDNFELGWKTTLADNQLRFNGSAFYIDITNLQTTIFDTSIVNLFFSDNAADAKVLGVEGDFTYAPISVDGLTLSGAFSFLDSEITNVITPTGDVVQGDELAFAPSFQGNLRARYEWDTGGGLTGHVMPSIVYSSASNSDILRQNTDRVQGYTQVGLATGLTGDNWTAEIFANNLFDDSGEISRFYGNDRERITPVRPRTIGARIAYNFR
ncbi:MAG: TonB-dependent receptor [Hyphomonadaceae bacterium]|nr:TonB-dependent receptor [Hyphomonadaceae bacterium]